jgi:hypothetical protein
LRKSRSDGEFRSIASHYPLGHLPWKIGVATLASLRIM